MICHKESTTKLAACLDLPSPVSQCHQASTDLQSPHLNLAGGVRACEDIQRSFCFGLSHHKLQQSPSVQVNWSMDAVSYSRLHAGKRRGESLATVLQVCICSCDLLHWWSDHFLQGILQGLKSARVLFHAGTVSTSITFHPMPLSRSIKLSPDIQESCAWSTLWWFILLSLL